MSGSIIEVWLKQSLSDAEIAKIPQVLKRLNIEDIETRNSKSTQLIYNKMVCDVLTTHFEDKPEYKLALSEWHKRLWADLRKPEAEIEIHKKEFGVVFKYHQHLLAPDKANKSCRDMSVYVHFDSFELTWERDYLDEQQISSISNIIEALSYIPSTCISILSLFTARGLCALDMAYIAIEIAKEFDGLMYLHCGVQPIPEPILQGKVASNDWDTELRLWNVQNNDWVRNFVKQFSGKVIEIKRGTSIFGDEKDDYNLSHLVDVEFMEAWMKHPGFRVCRQ